LQDLLLNESITVAGVGDNTRPCLLIISHVVPIALVEATTKRLPEWWRSHETTSLLDHSPRKIQQNDTLRQEYERQKRTEVVSVFRSTTSMMTTRRTTRPSLLFMMPMKSRTTFADWSKNGLRRTKHDHAEIDMLEQQQTIVRQENE
jgi:hypothetical protein